MTKIESFTHWVVRLRYVVLGATALLLAAMVGPLEALRFDSSMEVFFRSGDPTVVNMERLRARFGDSEYLLVGVSAGDDDDTVFSRGALSLIDEITRFAEQREEVSKVASITKFERIVGHDGSIETVDLFPAGIAEATDEELSQAATTMKGETLAHGVIVTEDLRHASVVIRVRHNPGSVDHHVELVSALQRHMDAGNLREQGYAVHLTGSPLVLERFFTLSMEDSNTTFPLMMVLISVILGLLFRSVSGVFIPWAVVIASTMVAMGIQSLLGWPLNLINTFLPMILIAVGISDAVHIVSEFHSLRHAGLDRHAAAAKATAMMLRPCFYTSVTTAAGFLALGTVQIAPLQQFGVTAAIGVVLAFLFSVTLLPALLSFARVSSATSAKVVRTGRTAAFTRGLAAVCQQRRRSILAAFAIMMAVSTAYASTVEVDAFFADFFPEGSPVRESLAYFDEHHGGWVNLEFMVDAGEVGAALEPAFLAQVSSLTDKLNAHPMLGRAVALPEFLKRMNRVMHGDDPHHETLPSSRQMAKQYLLLYGMSAPDENLSDLRSPDDRYLRISTRVKALPSGELKRLEQELRTLVANDYPDLEVAVTGDVVLVANQDTYIGDGLLRSFGVALLVITACFALIFRSLGRGVLSLVPSVAPVVVAAGIMGALGIRLEYGTMLVASVTIGIAVDDTIHIMMRYGSCRSQGMGVFASVEAALADAGRAISYTSMILVVGFGALTLSSFIPNILLGVFSVVIIAGALVADLLLLPVILLFGAPPMGDPQHAQGTTAVQAPASPKV